MACIIIIPCKCVYWCTKMACSKLNTSDLSKVRNEALSAAAKWYDIGLELGMTADDLDVIQKANDDPKVCLREMLRQWLSGMDPESSWEGLIAALRKPVVNYPALASEIEQKFCFTSTEDQMRVDLLQLNDQRSLSIKRRPSPKPRHRILSVKDPWKRELVQSFKGITSREVTEDLVEKAKQCIKHCNERYNLVPFEKLLNENQVS